MYTTMMSTEAITEVGEEIMRKYLGNSYVDFVDIEDFVTSYMKIGINYEPLPDCMAYFAADGKTGCPVVNRVTGEVNDAVFPGNRIIINRTLCHNSGFARRRFAIACGAAEFILRKTGIANDGAIFCSQVKNLASILLMPQSVFAAALRDFGNAPVKKYGKLEYSLEDKLRIGKAANRMGVSFTALCIKLGKEGRMEERGMDEFFEVVLDIAPMWEDRNAVQ